MRPNLRYAEAYAAGRSLQRLADGLCGAQRQATCLLCDLFKHRGNWPHTHSREEISERSPPRCSDAQADVAKAAEGSNAE